MAQDENSKEDSVSSVSKTLPFFVFKAQQKGGGSSTVQVQNFKEDLIKSSQFDKEDRSGSHDSTNSRPLPIPFIFRVQKKESLMQGEDTYNFQVEAAAVIEEFMAKEEKSEEVEEVEVGSTLVSTARFEIERNSEGSLWGRENKKEKDKVVVGSVDKWAPDDTWNGAVTDLNFE